MSILDTKFIAVPLWIATAYGRHAVFKDQDGKIQVN
jgi:hypothetical protein